MTAPAVSPSAMTSSATNTTTSGGRLMRVLLASVGERVGPTRAEGSRPASPVSMRWTGRRTSEPRDFGGLGPARSRNAVGGGSGGGAAPPTSGSMRWGGLGEERRRSPPEPTGSMWWGGLGEERRRAPPEPNDINSHHGMTAIHDPPPPRV